MEDRTLPSGTTGALVQSYGQLPLSFEANQGQADAQVDFLAHGPGYALFLTPQQAVLSLQPSAPTSTDAASPGANGAVVRMQLVGANSAPPVTGLDRLPGISNYLVGDDPSQWHTNVPNYGRVQYSDVYNGVDLVYYGNQGQLEYDFAVAPGVDPGVIQLAFEGAQSQSLDSTGNLVLHTAGGDVVEHAPVLYQDSGGVRQSISGQYVLEGNGQVGIAVGAYDRSQPLIIDPVLVYSTYLGGSNNYSFGTGITVDSAGNAYVVGFTAANNFPTPGGPYPNYPGQESAFVSKFNATGTALLYSTYLGGSNGFSAGSAIAVDSAGNAYVTGTTQANNFPTVGSFHTSYPGQRSTFVSKLNATGSALVYSLYLGGSTGYAGGNSIAVDSSGNAYVTGATTATNFPTTPGALQTSAPGVQTAFVSKLNATGSALLYSTYLGTSTNNGLGIAVDGAGSAYVTGLTLGGLPTTPGAYQASFPGTQSAFVTKLNATGSGLLYSTYLGSSTNSTEGNGIAVDSAGSAYLTGTTSANDFPVTAGAFQTSNPGQASGQPAAFATKFNATGTALVYSSYLGGNKGALGNAIVVDSHGIAYVTGITQATDFPTTAQANQTIFQSSLPGQTSGFVSKFNPDGSGLLYSTYLGPQNGGADTAGIAVDKAGSVYVTGNTGDNNFPTTSGAFQTSLPSSNGSAFVIKFDLSIQLLTTSSTTTVTVGQAITIQVRAADLSNFAVQGYTSTVQVTSTDAAAILPTDATLNNGVGTITVTLQTPGEQIIYINGVAIPTINGVASLDVLPLPSPPPPSPPSTSAFAVGADAGSLAEVKVFNATTGQLRFDFLAYPVGFTGGVRVAVGDVNGDGFPEIITVPGPGWFPEIKVFDGQSGTLLRDFLAFPPTISTGMYVAVGDFNHDGYGDIVVGLDAGFLPWVRSFSGTDYSQQFNFFAYGTFSGGVRVAVGDVNGDGYADLLTAPGYGGAPEIKVYSGVGNVLLSDSLAFGPAYTSGVYIAAGDTNGDGKADVLVGLGYGNPPLVAVYSGADGSLLRVFYAYAPSFPGGVRVAAADVNGDGLSDIVTTPGFGGPPEVRAVDAVSPTVLDDFFALPVAFLGGAFVGGG